MRYMDKNASEKSCGACKLLSVPWPDTTQLGLLVLRVGIGVLMSVHGWEKLEMLLEGKGGAWLDPLGIGSTLSLFLAMSAELFCSILLIAGFLTRLAALVLMINFSVIVFVFDPSTSWNASYELGVVYLVAYVALFLTGAGKLSVDHFITGKLLKARDC